MKHEGFINMVSDDEIKQAKAENEGVKLCIIEAELDDGQKFEGLFREPNNAIVKRFVAQANNAKSDGMSHHDAFVRDCILSPSRDEYIQLLKELPALSLTISPKLIEGHGLSNDSKKKSV